MDEITDGLTQSWISSAVHQIFTPDLRLPGQFRAISARVMKMKALTIDGPAPVAAVYAPHRPTMIAERSIDARRDFPRKKSRRLIIR